MLPANTLYLFRSFFISFYIASPFRLRELERSSTDVRRLIPFVSNERRRTSAPFLAVQTSTLELCEKVFLFLGCFFSTKLLLLPLSFLLEIKVYQRLNSYSNTSQRLWLPLAVSAQFVWPLEAVGLKRFCFNFASLFFLRLPVQQQQLRHLTLW